MGTIKLPLELNQDNDFIQISYQEEISQKFKILLLTNPGEKIMMPEFGVGIKKYLFEMTSGFLASSPGDQNIYLESYKENLARIIKYQLSLFLPSVELAYVETRVEDITLYVKIYYNNSQFFEFSSTVS